MQLPVSPAMTQGLWDLVNEAQASDPLSPVTIIGPSRYANLTLRNELARHGFVNVRFYDTPLSSRSLWAPGGSPGRRPMEDRAGH